LGIGDWGFGAKTKNPNPKTKNPKPQTQKKKIIIFKLNNI